MSKELQGILDHHDDHDQVGLRSGLMYRDSTDPKDKHLNSTTVQQGTTPMIVRNDDLSTIRNPEGSFMETPIGHGSGTMYILSQDL